MQAAEARMRRALGLEGGAAKPRPQERQETPQRQSERFVPGHNGHPVYNGHKRRFVQDGEVPVTVVGNRRDGAAEAAPHRGASVSAAPNRLEAAEHALAHETAGRQQAERALADAHASVHDLQTKLGHAELARVEAVEGLRREQEIVGMLRAELRDCEERLRMAEVGRASAERGVRTRRARLAYEVSAPDEVSAPEDEVDARVEDAHVAPPHQPARRGRPPGKKAAPRSKLVRWWVKDDAKAD